MTLFIDKLDDMIMDTPGGGYFAERAKFGWATNTISTHTAEYRIGPVKEVLTQVPEIPGYDIVMYEAPFYLRTFCPLSYYDKIGIRRYDTLVNGKMREQELLRHMVKSRSIVEHSSFSEITAEASSIAPGIVVAFVTSRVALTTEGDWSVTQWQRYVNGHASSIGEGNRKGSRSPFYIIQNDQTKKYLKWDDIRDNPQYMKETYAIATVDVKAHISSVQNNLDKYKNKYLDPRTTLAAIRPRAADPGDETDPDSKGEVVIISENQFERYGIIRKWRGRKTGSQGILSIEEWSIYDQHDRKLRVYSPFYKYLGDLLPGIEIHFLIMEGLKFFLSLDDNDIVKASDLSNAEKQIGIVFKPYYPVATDLGHPDFPPELAAELYSGRSDTGPWSEALLIIYLRVMLKLGYMFKKVWMYRDGMALDTDAAKIAAFPGLGLGNTVAGFMTEFPPMQKHFGPISFVTDSPDSRLTYDIGAQPQRQIQSMQYWGRIMQSIVTNDVAGAGECSKYIRQILKLKAMTDEEYTNYVTTLGSTENIEVLKQVLGSIDSVERNVELTTIIAKTAPGVLKVIFAENGLSAEFVKTWFNAQNTNVQSQTDRRVTNGKFIANTLASDE